MWELVTHSFCATGWFTGKKQFYHKKHEGGSAAKSFLSSVFLHALHGSQVFQYLAMAGGKMNNRFPHTAHNKSLFIFW